MDNLALAWQYPFGSDTILTTLLTPPWGSGSEWTHIWRDSAKSTFFALLRWKNGQNNPLVAQRHSLTREKWGLSPQQPDLKKTKKKRKEKNRKFLQHHLGLPPPPKNIVLGNFSIFLSEICQNSLIFYLNLFEVVKICLSKCSAGTRYENVGGTTTADPVSTLILISPGPGRS